MNAIAIDWQQVFAAQVRAIQAIYPASHKALLDWAAWSRDIGKVPGLTNHLSTPSLWDQCVTSKFSDWADEQDIEPANEDVKPEAAEREEYDPKTGEEIDAVLHDPDFPAVWRRVLKATYYWRSPEYQAPGVCRLDPDNFLTFLEGALRRLTV